MDAQTFKPTFTVSDEGALVVRLADGVGMADCWRANGSDSAPVGQVVL